MIYARQVPFDLQESPLWIDVYPENEFPVIVPGRNLFWESKWADLYRHIEESYDIIASFYEEISDKFNRENAFYKNYTELFQDYYFSKFELPVKLSTKIVHDLKEYMKLYGTRKYYEGDVFVEILSILTGLEWRKTTIRGCCQSDWADIVYIYKSINLHEFENLYFNLGTEWEIHDNENEVNVVEDIDGYYMYLTESDYDDVRNRLAKEFNCAPDDIVLFYVDKAIQKIECQYKIC